MVLAPSGVRIVCQAYQKGAKYIRSRYLAPQSIILTATAAMAGGTQLFEGAHLTGGNMRFCRESSKCRNYVLFVGEVIK